VLGRALLKGPGRFSESERDEVARVDRLFNLEEARLAYDEASLDER
jgi:hypothetical protein